MYLAIIIFLLASIYSSFDLYAEEQLQELCKKESKEKEPEDKEPDEKESKKKEPDKKEPDKKEPDKKEPDEKKPDEKESKEKDPDEKESDKKEPKEEEKVQSPHKFTGLVAFLSDYRDRGISQTMREPGVQGELKYTHESGFYFKTTGYNVDGTGNFIHNSSLEWDFYLGCKRKILCTSIEWDIGFLYYYYPEGEAFVPKRVPYDTVEYYLAFIYKGFELKLSLTLTDYFGINSDNPPINWDKNRPIRPNGHSYYSPYVEANFEWEFCPKWTSTLHVGYQGVTNYFQLSYVDWLIGIAYQFDWFNVSIAYVASNARHAFYDVPDSAFKPERKHLGAPAVVVVVSRTF